MTNLYTVETTIGNGEKGLYFVLAETFEDALQKVKNNMSEYSRIECVHLVASSKVNDTDNTLLL